MSTTATDQSQLDESLDFAPVCDCSHCDVQATVSARLKCGHGGVSLACGPCRATVDAQLRALAGLARCRYCNALGAIVWRPL